MQTNYIVIPWDSLHKDHTWCAQQIIEKGTRPSAVENSYPNITINDAILGFLIYNLVIVFFLFFRNEKMLYRKNKAVEGGQ